MTMDYADAMVAGLVFGSLLRAGTRDVEVTGDPPDIEVITLERDEHGDYTGVAIVRSPMVPDWRYRVAVTRVDTEPG